MVIRHINHKRMFVNRDVRASTNGPPTHPTSRVHQSVNLLKCKLIDMETVERTGDRKSQEEVEMGEHFRLDH